MNDVTEGIGIAVEGGLMAGTVEDGNANGDPVQGDGGCFNCGTKLSGAHCHNCGQKAHIHRSLSGVAHDLVHGVLHLDGKLWRTLPLLTFKPGAITRRYIAGERAKFVSPMAMFLFSIFLMFAVFQAIGLTAPANLPGDVGVRLGQAMTNEIERLSGELNSVDTRLRAPDLEQEERQSLVEERADLKAKLGELREARGLPVIGGLVGDAGGSAEIVTEAGSPQAGQSLDSRAVIGKTGVPLIDKLSKKWRENPSLMLYKLQANGYKFSWLLIPISVPLVWLLFAFSRRFKAYDHAIFVTYSLAFMSVLFVGLSLLSAAGIGGGWVFLSLAVIPPLHLYKQLRGAYQLSRISALWRLLALMAAILVVLAIFLQILLLLGSL